jgi:hypothetical protein
MGTKQGDDDGDERLWSGFFLFFGAYRNASAIRTFESTMREHNKAFFIEFVWPRAYLPIGLCECDDKIR